MLTKEQAQELVNQAESIDLFNAAKSHNKPKTRIPAENLMMSATHTHSAEDAR